MSKKLKIKGNVTRVGNFIIRKIDTGNERFEINNAANNFKLHFHINHPSYDLIELAIEMNTLNYLGIWLNSIWVLATGVKDMHFFEDLRKAYQAQLDRTPKEETLSEEEDQKILDEMKTDYDVEEQIKNADKIKKENEEDLK